MLKNGANPNDYFGSEGDRITPLLAAAILKKEEIALTLIAYGADSNATYDGYSVLDFARHFQLDALADEIDNTQKRRGK